MAKDAGDIGTLKMNVDTSQVRKATRDLEKLRDLIKQLERDHGVKVSTIMKAKAKVG